MIMREEVFERMFVLLGADTATIGQTSTPLKIILIQAPFTPSPTLQLSDITPADFDGSTSIAANSAPQPQSMDPANGDSLLDVPAGAGGYRWETTGTTNLPQTIYGYALTDGGTVLLGSQLLPSIVTLTGINQSIVVPRVGYRQAAASVS